MEAAVGDREGRFDGIGVGRVVGEELGNNVGTLSIIDSDGVQGMENPGDFVPDVV